METAFLEVENLFYFGLREVDGKEFEETGATALAAGGIRSEASGLASFTSPLRASARRVFQGVAQTRLKVIKMSYKPKVAGLSALPPR